MLHQRDAVGLAIHDERLRTLVPPKSSSKQLMHILQTLEKTAPAARRISRRSGIVSRANFARGMVLIFSDCFDDVQHVIHALRHLRHRQHEVILFHILAPEEIEFPFTKRTQFRHLEIAEQLRLIDPSAVREAYLKNFNRSAKRCACKQRTCKSTIMS